MRKLLSTVVLFLFVLGSVSVMAASPRDLIIAGRVNEAISSLRTHIQKSPSDVEAHLLLARAYYYMQRWDESINAAEKAVSLAPANFEAHLWLGRAYGLKAENASWISATSLARKVRAEFERAVQLNPSHVQARMDLAEFYVDAPGFLGGGKDKARAQAGEIAKQDKSQAHLVLAWIAEHEKDHTRAEQEFRSAVETAGGKNGERWVDLANFYRRRGRWNDMQEAVDKAAAIEAGNGRGTPLFDAAGVLFRAGRNFDGAINLVRTYLNSGTHTEEAPVFEAHYLLGSILEKQGKRAEAAEQYRAALALASDFAPAKEALRRVQ